MIRVLLILSLALGIRSTKKPMLVWGAYTGITTLYLVLSTQEASSTVLAMSALYSALAALYTWILHKLLSYAEMDHALYWLIALALGLCIGMI